jgi:hypothetical protein
MLKRYVSLNLFLGPSTRIGKFFRARCTIIKPMVRTPKFAMARENTTDDQLCLESYEFLPNDSPRRVLRVSAV